MSVGDKRAHLNTAFLKRVQRSYRLAMGQTAAAQGMWADIDQRRADIHKALLSPDCDRLSEIFAEPATTDLYYGVDNLCRSIVGDRLPGKPGIDPSARDVLIGIGRHRGADSEVEQILTELDSDLNQKINFPTPFRGEVGWETSRGLMSYRAAQALYQTLLLVKLCRSSTSSVVEIGPGMGRTAFYAYRAGIIDYTTVDLPLGVVAQACFLGATLGPDNIWLAGDNEAEMHGRIRLLSACHRPQRIFDVALNIDSMTEMPLSVALDYLVWIGHTSKAFLSVNHGANGYSVPEAARVALTIKDHYRSIYPIRDGYHEDFFIFSGIRTAANLRFRHRLLTYRMHLRALRRSIKQHAARQ